MKGYDCKTCTEELKKVRGCYNDNVKLYFPDNIVINRCPLLLVNTEDFFYLQQYKLLVSGFPVDDDSALFADYVLLFDDLVGKSKVDMFFASLGGN